MADENTDDATDAQGGADTPEKAHKVTVEGPGISITRPVDEATMSSVIALLFGAGAPTQGGGSGGGGAGGGGRGATTLQWDEDLTLGEFITETTARSFPQKICAAGYYLTNFRGAASFDRDEVRAALGGAHEDMPANFARDWTAAASHHLIAQKDGEAGRYVIPRTGRTAVESNFSEVPRRRARRSTKKSSGGSKADAE